MHLRAAVKYEREVASSYYNLPLSGIQSHARSAVIALLQKRVYSREDGVATGKTRAVIVRSAPVVYGVDEEGEYPHASSFQCT